MVDFAIASNFFCQIHKYNILIESSVPQ